LLSCRTIGRICDALDIERATWHGPHNLRVLALSRRRGRRQQRGWNGSGWLSPEQLAEELNWLDERVEGGYGVDVVIPQKYEGMDVEIASIPEQIRGYGYVKEEHLQKAKSYEAEMLAAWRNETPSEEAA
jgi:hypothetical protein